jgi:hypothetical protein
MAALEDTSGAESSVVCCALEQDAVLAHVYAYVGSKDYIFFGGVCKQWRELASAHSTDTAVSSAFGSYARLEYSLAVGIRNTLKTRDISAALCFAAGLGGSQDTITAALANGMPLHKALCAGAARSGRCELLQWLRYEQLCPWSVESIAMSVCDDVEMLKYLWSKEPWTKNAYYICNAAARKGCFAALKWMASANCLWDVFDELTTEVSIVVALLLRPL